MPHTGGTVCFGALGNELEKVMSKKVLLAAAFLVAGCSQQPAQQESTAPDAAPQAVQAESEPCPPAGYSATPDGVTVDHDYLVRADRMYVARSGDERRRTTLELLDGDPRTVAEAALATLMEQGFRQLDIPDRGDGVLRLAVHEPGVGRINISATDDRGGNPAHPRSVGLVGFDMPMAPAGAEPAVDSEGGDVEAAEDAAAAG